MGRGLVDFLLPLPKRGAEMPAKGEAPVGRHQHGGVRGAVLCAGKHDSTVGADVAEADGGNAGGMKAMPLGTGGVCSMALRIRAASHGLEAVAR